MQKEFNSVLFKLSAFLNRVTSSIDGYADKMFAGKGSSILHSFIGLKCAKHLQFGGRKMGSIKANFLENSRAHEFY